MKMRRWRTNTKDRTNGWEKYIYTCGGERETRHSAAGEVLMIITNTETLKMDVHRYTPADVTFPLAFVGWQVPVKRLKTPRLIIFNSLTGQTGFREIGLILYATSNLQRNTIYLGEQWGHLRNSLFCQRGAVLRLWKKYVCMRVSVCVSLAHCRLTSSSH